MKNRIGLGFMALALVFISSFAVASDEGEYNVWTYNQGDNPLLRIAVGNRPSKQSGWFSIENVGQRGILRVCYTIFHGDGTNWKACMSLKSHEVQKRSDAGCGQESKSKGCTGYEIRELKFVPDWFD